MHHVMCVLLYKVVDLVVKTEGLSAIDNPTFNCGTISTAISVRNKNVH